MGCSDSEATIALSPKMLELQQAMDLYGDTTWRNYEASHKFGNEITDTMGAYLGEGSRVFGVNPEGEWSHDKGDHRDASFSTYHSGYLRIEPIKIGIAIRIPHSKDNGAYWIRVVVEMEFVGDTMKVDVGGKKLHGIQIEYSKADVERVQDLIFIEARDTMRNPAAEATGQGRPRIGFIND